MRMEEASLVFVCQHFRKKKLDFSLLDRIQEKKNSHSAR